MTPVQRETNIMTSTILGSSTLRSAEAIDTERKDKQSSGKRVTAFLHLATPIFVPVNFSAERHNDLHFPPVALIT